jgi:hypothetical protein
MPIYGYFLAVLSEPEMILVVVHCVVFYMFNISCSYFGIFFLLIIDYCLLQYVKSMGYTVMGREVMLSAFDLGIGFSVPPGFCWRVKCRLNSHSSHFRQICPCGLKDGMNRTRLELMG